MSQNPADRQHLEMEIKYSVSTPCDLEDAFENFRTLAIEILRQREYQTVIRYFDTDALDLLRSGTTLRKMDECLPHFRPQIDVKTLGHVTERGILVRDEFKFYPKEDRLDLSAIDNDIAKELIAAAQGKPLTEIFHTVSTRKDMRAVFNINAKRAAIEISVEKTDYIDSQTGASLKTGYEIELEYSQHHSDRNITHDEALALIDTLGKTLAHKIDSMTVNTSSKAETGFSFFRSRSLPPAP